MEDLYIPGTQLSPEVRLDCQQHVLEITGESYPEDCSTFYFPILRWLDEYLENLKEEEVVVHLTIPFANSSSCKVLMDILELFDEAAAYGQHITVNWFYNSENQYALEFGHVLETLESLPFHLIPMQKRFTE